MLKIAEAAARRIQEDAMEPPEAEPSLSPEGTRIIGRAIIDALANLEAAPPAEEAPRDRGPLHRILGRLGIS